MYRLTTINVMWQRIAHTAWNKQAAPLGAAFGNKKARSCHQPNIVLGDAEIEAQSGEPRKMETAFSNPVQKAEGRCNVRYLPAVGKIQSLQLRGRMVKTRGGEGSGNF